MTARRKQITATLRDYQLRILRVLDHIQRQLDTPLSLDELAAVACFSPFHFHRVFKGMVGESVHEHVRRLRLERAATRLRAGVVPVTEIAFEAGYGAHEAFTRIFKTAYTVPPVQFRRERWRHTALMAPSAVHYRDGQRLIDFNPPPAKIKKMKVIIKKLEPIRVVYLRHTGPTTTAHSVAATWQKFGRLLAGHQGRCIGINYDDPESIKFENMRYDCCMAVDTSYQPTGELRVQNIVGGEYAVTQHRGSYGKMDETYAELMGQWLPRSGRQPAAAPCFQISLNDPQFTAPESLLTEIYLPLEPTVSSDRGSS